MTGRWMFLVVAFALVLAACQKSGAEPKRYQLSGEIVKLNPTDRAATIKHEKIEGWMDAMTMEFPVKDSSEFAKLAVGQRVTATLFVAEDGPFWIADIKPASEPPRSERRRAIPASWSI